jgi:glutathione S-transferase
MSRATLTINSRNYGAWSLRGWLLCAIAGLEVDLDVVPMDDPESRAELLLLAPSFLVPRLDHEGVRVWDTLAIAEHLNETRPDSGLLPREPRARAHCRAVSGEMHAGFQSLRSALPMNIRARVRGRTSIGSSPSGTSAWRPTAAPGCSARHRRWPTPCTRPS